MANTEAAGAAGLVMSLVPLLFVMLLLVVPFIRILHRAGRSGWWVLLLFIPGFGWLILPWVIAFMRWETPSRNYDEVFR